MKKAAGILLSIFSANIWAWEACPKYFPKWQGDKPKMEYSIDKRNGMSEITVKVPPAHEGLQLSVMNAEICLEDKTCINVPLRYFEEETHTWSSFDVTSKQKGSAIVTARYAVGLCSPTISEEIEF